jgi:hypothetical protein
MAKIKYFQIFIDDLRGWDRSDLVRTDAESTIVLLASPGTKLRTFWRLQFV